MLTVEGRYSTLWQAREVLYARCMHCNAHMPWRVFHGTCNLVSSCCGYCYTAEPHFEAQKYRVTRQKADLNNVVVLSIVVDESA